MCNPLNPSMENYSPLIWHQLFFTRFTCFYLWEPLLICQNIFLFVRTHFYLSESLLLYDHLWECLLIYDHLLESIFLNLNENKQAYEHHQFFFYHQETIMIFCWSHMLQFYVFYFEFFSFCAFVFCCFMLAYLLNSSEIFTPFAALDFCYFQKE